MVNRYIRVLPYISISFIYILLYTSFQYKEILFLSLLLILLIILIQRLKENASIIRLWYLGVIGIIVYCLLYKLIGSIELWGDEIGVLMISKGSFGNIVQMVSSYHASVPPFDYWMMWGWDKIIRSWSITPVEFWYRIPYMFFHLAGSILFTHIVTIYFNQNEKRIPRWISIILEVFCFTIYFFNPILFFYSIEVRFYALSIVGATLSLYLYDASEDEWVRILPFILLLCLNSVYEYILIFVVLVFRSIVHKKTPSFSLLVPLLVIFVLIFPFLLIPIPITPDKSFSLIRTALYHLLSFQFWSYWQRILLLGVLVYCFLLKDLQKKISIIFMQILCMLFIICGLSYVKGYFDFHVRHLAFVVPYILYIIVSPLKFLKPYQKLLYGAIIIAILIIPWTRNNLIRLESKELFSKSLPGVKYVLEKAKEKNIQIILFPNDGQLVYWDYQFNINSWIWYGKYFPTVTVFQPRNSIDACNLLVNTSSYIVADNRIHISCNKRIEYESLYSQNIYRLSSEL